MAKLGAFMPNFIGIVRGGDAKSPYALGANRRERAAKHREKAQRTAAIALIAQRKSAIYLAVFAAWDATCTGI
jgi:hypothetical protein